MDDTIDIAPQRAQATAQEAERLVVKTIAAHAPALLRTAGRHSLCYDDAQDAYQRALEIFLRHAPRLDSDHAKSWLHTVVKHEAMAVRKARQQFVASEEVDFDGFEDRHVSSPEDQVIAFEEIARSAEALQRLKPQEVHALWLQIQGLSYQEIADATGWTYTKVGGEVGLSVTRSASMPTGAA
jgi:RNA polymerase sigma factor (sigma-70 family)